MTMAIGIGFEERNRACVWRREVRLWTRGGESEVTEEKKVKLIVKLYRNVHYFEWSLCWCFHCPLKMNKITEKVASVDVLLLAKK